MCSPFQNRHRPTLQALAFLVISLLCSREAMADPCAQTLQETQAYDRADAKIAAIVARAVLAQSRGRLEATGTDFTVTAYGAPDVAGDPSAEFAEIYSAAVTAQLRQRVSDVLSIVIDLDASLRSAIDGSPVVAGSPTRVLTIDLLNFDYPRGTEAQYFCVDTDGDGIDDECTLQVFKRLWQGSDESLRFTLAHEMFHHVQAATFPAVDRCESFWWVEGTAEWFANLAVPSQTFSADFLERFDTTSEIVMLTQMDYEAVAFWFWASERFGDSYPLSLGTFGNEGLADTRGIASNLSAVSWANFVRTYLNGRLHYPDGRAAIPTPRLGNTVELVDGTPVVMEAPQPLTVPRQQLRARQGRWEITVENMPETLVASERGIGGFHFEGGSSGGGTRVVAVFSACDTPSPLAFAAFNHRAAPMTATFVGTFLDDQCAPAPCVVGTWTEVSERERLGRAVSDALKEELRGSGIVVRMSDLRGFINRRTVTLGGGVQMFTTYPELGPQLSIKTGGQWQINDPHRILAVAGSSTNDRFIDFHGEGGTWEVSDDSLVLVTAWEKVHETHTVVLPSLPASSAVIDEFTDLDRPGRAAYGVQCSANTMELDPGFGNDLRVFVRVSR